MNITDFLVSIRRINKMHESMLKEICEEYELSLLEANIISFLHNHPSKDTARDIVELRMLSKGNVSRAVEVLIQKRLLGREPDQQDRRKMHLSLLPASRGITDAIDDKQNVFFKELFSGFSEQEKQQLWKFNERILKNADDIMRRRDI